MRMSPGDKHANPLYAAMTEDLDTGVGMVLDAIEKLGIAGTTYVVYTADNGPYVNTDENRIKGEISSAAPLNKGKFWVYEGGIRAPFLVKGPGVPAGSVCRRTVTPYDLYPTFCDLAGSKEWPAELDGGSIRPLLQGDDSEEVERPRDFLVFHYPHFNRQATPHTAIIQGDYKLLKYWEDGRLELYNLKEDLGERRNLASDMPERTTALELSMMSYLDETGALIPTRRR